MKRYYLRLAIAASLLRVLSVCLHYAGASPWGGAVVAEPMRFVPDASLIEIGVVTCLAMMAGLFERALGAGSRAWLASVWRALATCGIVAYCVFSQLDHEVVRWLGQHITYSFARNFLGVKDPLLLQRILSGDRLWSSLAVAQMALAAGGLGWLWWRERRDHTLLGPRAVRLGGVVALAAVLAPAWFRPSEKRWRRIRPALLTIAWDAGAAVSGRERPREPARATAELAAWVDAGREPGATQPPAKALPGHASGASDAFPLWRRGNLGRVPVEQFAQLPRERRPNIVFVVFETMRAWNTGLAGAAPPVSDTPQLDALLGSSALVFPYMHSAGYPSVEGCMGMHLGIWPHFRRIVFSDYLHVRTRALPEILRQAGYETHALLGADPSFSNFTPWFERWYDEWEYTPANRADEPLVNRFEERFAEQAARGVPVFSLLWTATTHPPYDLPASEGVPLSPSVEENFSHAIAYADRHVARLLNWLRARPDWNNTIVVVMGDHAQPTPTQWKAEEVVGRLTPGNTWTVMALLGGWPGLPQPGRVEQHASHIDVAPTLLALLNLDAPNHFMGRNLLGSPAEPFAARPVLSFRYGDAALLRGRERWLFEVTGGRPHGFAIDPGAKVSYGLLDPAQVKELPATAAPPLDAYRDAILAYGSLLDENRLMPPPPAGNNASTGH